MTKHNAKLALLSGAVDYAGMFPPASLSLEGTLKKAASFRREAQHPWLMNKVVLALDEIKKLTPALLYESGANGSAWLFSALGTAFTGPSKMDFLKQLEWDLREMARFQERFYYSSCRQEIIAYEFRLPDYVFQEETRSAIQAEIHPILDHLDSALWEPLDVYLEVPLTGNWQAKIEASTEALADWLEEFDDSLVSPGIKVRTGGQSKPTATQLATVIHATASHGLRFKATQGLHHPISHESDFGFMNLFAALTFAYHEGVEAFSIEKIQSALVDETKGSFLLKDTSFSWKDHSLSTEEIERVRRVHCGSFGSCSLDEPDQFLKQEFP